MSLGTVLGACGVCAHDPVERAALVAMTVEATNEVPAVLVRLNRGARVRTGDLTAPNGARYQAAPRPDAISESTPYRC
jgi:hypothetical protein